MVRQHCTGSDFMDAIRSAVANLERHVDEINALNVFPVPDGDTGTNMLATVRAALDEAETASPDAPVERVAAAVSHGALMGARGNSGVITSQILRGVAEGLAGRKRFNGLDLANALALGAKTAYGAVGKPVEGTILTVIRESAAAAVAAAEDDDAMESVLAATVDAARTSVARTPSLLPILREAGVVDSGGQGLFRLFEGALASVRGKPLHAAAIGGRGTHAEERVAVAPAFRSGVAALEENAYGYETVFILTAAADTTLDVPAIQTRLEELGNSVLVGGDGRMVKVHVHNERPDEIIAYGLSLGALTRITVENLDTMADDVREARATEFVGQATATAAVAETAGGDRGGAAVATGSRGGGAVTAASGSRSGSPPGGTQPLKRSDLPTPDRNGTHPPVDAPGADRTASGSSGSSGLSGATESEGVEIDPALGPAIVAVVAGDGLEKLFREFGVAHIVRGGQTANPSTGELLRIARLARSREVLLLPNNPNVRLAAEQAAQICEERRLVVVPTRNAAEGVAALLAYDPDADAAANAGPMATAGRGLATLQVTEAVRDAKIGGRKVKKGQTIALDPDDGLVAVDSDRTKAVMKAVATFPPGSELVTVYYGEDATLIEAEAIATRIGAALRAEVEVVHGGQPHYRYLISAE